MDLEDINEDDSLDDDDEEFNIPKEDVSILGTIVHTLFIYIYIY